MISIGSPQMQNTYLHTYILLSLMYVLQLSLQFGITLFIGSFHHNILFCINNSIRLHLSPIIVHFISTYIIKWNYLPFDNTSMIFSYDIYLVFSTISIQQTNCISCTFVIIIIVCMFAFFLLPSMSYSISLYSIYPHINICWFFKTSHTR